MAEKVDQDVREAAADALESEYGKEFAQEVRDGNHDDIGMVEAFARIKAAGRRQGLREAAEVAREVSWMGMKDTAYSDGVFKVTRRIATAITALMDGEGK